MKELDIRTTDFKDWEDDSLIINEPTNTKLNNLRKDIISRLAEYKNFVKSIRIVYKKDTNEYIITEVLADTTENANTIRMLVELIIRDTCI